MRMKRTMLFGMMMQMFNNKSQHKMLMNGMKPVEVSRQRAAVVPRSRDFKMRTPNGRALRIRRELKKLKL